LAFFSLFFPWYSMGMIPWWGWYPDGYHREYGKKKLAGTLRSLKRLEYLFMANVWTEPYCDKVESDFWILRKKESPIKNWWFVTSCLLLQKWKIGWRQCCRFFLQVPGLHLFCGLSHQDQFHVRC
jgi:hypothetical protein